MTWASKFKREIHSKPRIDWPWNPEQRAEIESIDKKLNILPKPPRSDELLKLEQRLIELLLASPLSEVTCRCMEQTRSMEPNVHPGVEEIVEVLKIVRNHFEADRQTEAGDETGRLNGLKTRPTQGGSILRDEG
jgi:hypothetical protein